MKKIILTGGGTAGHVTPNIALLPALNEAGYRVTYVGAHRGIEKELIEACGVEYKGISAGKLRRYFDLKNVSDAFRVVKGLSEAVKIIKKQKPQVIFSKGGFVAVPVVMAGRLCNVPVVLHESDITPGLANRLSLPFVKTACVTFPETLQYIPKNKARLTGTPIRQELFCGEREKGLSFCGLNEDKPIIMVMGGSSGSVKINRMLHSCLNDLLSEYQVIHICGKGNVDSKQADGFKQFEYVTDMLPHLFASADIVVSRAGANSISEFLALKKPALLIPLGKEVSRGDQILNARSFSKQGYSRVLLEENMTPESLLAEINYLHQNKEQLISAMSKSLANNAVEKVMEVILAASE